MAVTEMRMVIEGDIKPASTAACPIISAPTTETALPIALACLMIWKDHFEMVYLG
ncbi:hypothetical protein V7056_09920 [Bacillus sp. JJ664]